MSRGTWKPPIGGKQRHEKDTSYPDKVLTYRHSKQTFAAEPRPLSATVSSPLQSEDSGLTGHGLCIACCWSCHLLLATPAKGRQQRAGSGQNRKRLPDIGRRKFGSSGSSRLTISAGCVTCRLPEGSCEIGLAGKAQ